MTHKVVDVKYPAERSHMESYEIRESSSSKDMN